MIAIADLDDYQLLRRFVDVGCEEAFNQLVNSHIDSVYSVSLRETNDPVLAQDVTQAVFLTLLQKASTIGSKTVLSGWLFNTARFAAKNAMRQERRRRDIEQESIEEASQNTGHVDTWQAIEPVLHEAIAALGTKDRDAILLRFFEDKSLKEVGAALHITEHAAQMRVLRAVEKMKQHLRKKGIVVPVTLLSTLLTEHAVQATPTSCVQAMGHLMPSLAAGGTSASSATATKAHSISKGVLKSMAIQKLKVASMVAAFGVTGIVGATRPFGTFSPALAQPASPVALPVMATTAAGMPIVSKLPMDLMSVNVGAKTVRLIEFKISVTKIPDGLGGYGFRAAYNPWKQHTARVTAKTVFTRYDTNVPVAQLRVGDIVSNGIRKFSGPQPGLPPGVIGRPPAPLSTKYIGNFRVVAVNPLRLQRIAAAGAEVKDEEVITLSSGNPGTVPDKDEPKVFLRIVAIKLADIAALAARDTDPDSTVADVDVETSKSPDGKLEVKKILVGDPDEFETTLHYYEYLLSNAKPPVVSSKSNPAK